MENRKGKTQEPGDVNNQYLNRRPCSCQPLHSGCDPKFCDKAVSAPLSEWVEHGGPLGLFEIDGQWEKGAVEGCVTCGAILAAGEQVLKLYNHDTSRRNAVSPASFAVKRKPGTFQVSKDTCMSEFVLLFKKSGISSPKRCQAIPYSTEASASAESDAAFDFCKVRLQKCIETHTACHTQSLYKHPLPKRVLDIGYRDQKLAEGQGESFHPHLVELGHGQNLAYITLSHCWGQKQIITTTKNTLASRLKSVPWTSLSKTFQDAVYVTHRLGYQYLWIDSLCIIQDDEVDWQMESRKMASTYQHSVFTIAASKSTNGDGGCFTATLGLVGEELYHPYTDLPTGINWRHPLVHMMEPPPRWSGFDFSKWEWPLSLRAWTLQEERLSSRVIYYGPNELLWQCNTTFNCQCGKFRRARPFERDCTQGHLNKVEFAAALDMELRKTRTVANHQRTLEIQWASIIQQYLNRELTKETDLFPALSGLAKQIQAAGLAPLVAGIPANNVLPWLLWTARPPTKTPTVYIAPSWSWASYKGLYTVDFNHPHLTQPGSRVESEPVAHVVDIAAEPAGLDPTGALKSGQLVLFSLATTVTFRYDIDRLFGCRTALFNLAGDEELIRTPHIDCMEDVDLKG